MTPRSKTGIRIISRDDFKLFHKIDTDGNISCLAWSSDGTLFATGSEKGKVRIYNAKEWLATLQLSGARSTSLSEGIGLLTNDRVGWSRLIT